MSRARDIADGKFANDLTVDTNTLFVDAANNKIGVGTTTPDTYSDYVSGSLTSGLAIAGSFPGIQLADTDVSGSNSTFGISKAGQSTTVNNLGAGSIKFYTAGGQRVNITEHGLTFNADTASANALNDFEQGSWTPVFDNSVGNSPTVNYSYQVGRYTKVGNRVHWVARISWSAFTMNGSGYAFLAGFPFTSDSTFAFSQGGNVFGYASGISGSYGLSGLYIDAGQNRFYMTTGANPTAEIFGSAISGSGTIYCGGSIQVQ